MRFLILSMFKLDKNLNISDPRTMNVSKLTSNLIMENSFLYLQCNILNAMQNIKLKIECYGNKK